MRTNLFLFGMLILWTVYSCQSDTRERSANGNEEVNTNKATPTKLLEYLVGDWQVDNAGANQNQQGHIPERLTFTEEGRYIVYSGNQKIDSGSYRMNEQLRNLYLESAANKTAIEYEISANQDVMTLKPKLSAAGASDSLSYRRIGSGSISPEKRGEQ